MAYGVKYQIRWQTVTADFLRFEILEKDYEGNISELTGAGNVCSIAYESGDDKIINAFKPSKCTITYRNEAATPLRSFYSEDDEKYKGQLIDENDESIRWAGFLVQDDCKEKFLDPPYPVTLVFTDNLGLLKNINFDQAYADFGYDEISASAFIVGQLVTIVNVTTDPESQAGENILIDGVPYEITGYFMTGTTLQMFLLNAIPANGNYTVIYTNHSNKPIGKITLWTIIRTALKATGVTLPVRVYNSLYETSHDENKNMFDQTRVFTGKWLDDDGIWKSIYGIIEEILTTFHATLVQADGFWNIVRWAEARRTTDNNVEAIEYDENFANPFIITLPLNYDVITPETDVEMVGADAENRILRPFKMVKETFNYQQPKQLILGSDLQTPGAFISSSEITIEGITYRLDKYELPAGWGHYQTDASYIEVKTQLPATVFEEEIEVDRYVVTPGVNDSFNGVQFNGIEVTKGDLMDFSVTWAAFSNSSDYLRFGFTFVLYGVDGSVWYIAAFGLTQQDPEDVKVFWGESISGELYPPDVVFLEYSEDYDTSQYTTLALSMFGLLDGKKLTIPIDGVLKIIVHGTNNNVGSPRQTTKWKEITLRILNSINDSTNIIGQTHTDLLTNDMKNNYDEQITIDDSPRNTIAGTLFKNELVNFGYDIGSLYFNRTALWGYKGETKNQRLGQIITKERHTLARQARTLIDGAFVFDCPLLTPMNIIFISAIIELNFIFGVCEFDMMNMRCSTTLWELHETDEPDLTSDYEFKYLYQTN